VDFQRNSQQNFEKVEASDTQSNHFLEGGDGLLLGHPHSPAFQEGKEKVPYKQDHGLELATTFFKCYWCTEPISYPRILMHGCLLKDTSSKRGRKRRKDDEATWKISKRTRLLTLADLEHHGLPRKSLLIWSYLCYQITIVWVCVQGRKELHMTRKPPTPPGTSSRHAGKIP
jgi:hypothetical protein